jgi:hypothetical protein
VLRLRQALGLAERRDMVDADLRKAEADLARLPAVTTADPQAETMVALVTWLSGSRIAISQNDIAMTRMVAIALLPQVAGLVFMFAMALLGAFLQAILARSLAPPTRPSIGEVHTQDLRMEGAYIQSGVGPLAVAVSTAASPSSAGVLSR